MQLDGHQTASKHALTQERHRNFQQFDEMLLTSAAESASASLQKESGGIVVVTCRFSVQDNMYFYKFFI